MNVQNKYKGYTVKEKWFVCLLLSLFAPFTVYFFGPFEIYANNMSEFKFVLWDFLAQCALPAAIIAAELFAIFMFTRGRVFDICFGLVFGLSFMLFIQGNYLSLGAGSLSGDGLGETMPTSQIVINVLIWIVVVGGCVAAMLLLNRFRDTVRLISTVAVVALIGMTLISFLVISLTTDVYAKEKTGYQGDVTVENEVLTVKNLDTLATDNNIVVFIVDRFDHTYYDKALTECPEIFDSLDGFTHFDDYVTLYPRTYPAVAHIITGEEVDFSGSRLDYMQNAYGNSSYMKELKEKGFDINVYTDSFYGYDNASCMRELVSNTSGNIGYEIVNRKELSSDMVRVSLFRYLPFALRDTLGNVSTPMFDKYVEYEMTHDVFTTDMKNIYGELTDKAFSFRASEKGISYIHIAGCHLPNAYGTDFKEITEDEKYDVSVAMKQSFKIISAYISEMKRMGVYENSTIIILGDHCSIGSDSKLLYKSHVTTLLAKPAGVLEGAIAESKAQIGTENVFATILNAAGSDKASDYGETVFEVPENEDRVRRYYFQVYEGGVYNNAFYEVKGSGNEFENWHLVSVDPLGKSIYD